MNAPTIKHGDGSIVVRGCLVSAFRKSSKLVARWIVLKRGDMGRKPVIGLELQQTGVEPSLCMC